MASLSGLPFPIAFDVGAMLEAFATVRRLADRLELIVPGHGPLVLERFAPVRPDLEGIAVRLDRPRATRDPSFAGRAGGGE